MEKINVVLGIINTVSGYHIVVHRIGEDNFGFPGGKVKPGEKSVDALIREISEETNLVGFIAEDFEIINVQHRIEKDRELTLYTYGYKYQLNDDVPLSTAETHIHPMLMLPSQFYQRTKFKQYYINLFPN